MTIRVGNTIIATVNKNTDGGSGGLEVGDIGFAPLGIDETQNKRRYLNGQVISQSQFEAFTKIIKERVALYPSLVASEENWQAEITNSVLGQCGKFVIDEELGTIRLPKVVNINGLQDLALIGSIKAESLPSFNYNYPINHTGYPNGSSDSGNGVAYNQAYWRGWNEDKYIDSIYQDNAPVQQEAIQYPYFIQVATGVEESVDILREIELNNPFSLLDYKWSEYEITNASWLISDGTFYSGATYVAIYELLLKIYNGIETKEGTSVKLSTEEYTDTDFVINTTDTVFRLPIKVKLASGNAVVGNGNAMALTTSPSTDAESTTATHYFFESPNNSSLTGDESYATTPLPNGTTGGNYGGFANSSLIGLSPNPTLSGIETSASGLKLYFYVGETIQDANVIAASGILTKVASSVDKTSVTDRETVINWGKPDYSAAVSLSINADNTITTSGFVYLYTNNSSGSLYINDVYMGEYTWHSGVYHNYNMVMLPVSKGDVVKATAATIFNFYPSQGVN